MVDKAVYKTPRIWNANKFANLWRALKGNKWIRFHEDLTHIKPGSPGQNTGTRARAWRKEREKVDDGITHKLFTFSFPDHLRLNTFKLTKRSH
jgi:hypothetical protein